MFLQITKLIKNIKINFKIIIQIKAKIDKHNYQTIQISIAKIIIKKNRKNFFKIENMIIYLVLKTR